MLKKILPVFIITLITASCATIPSPVDEKYLVDAEKEEHEKLKGIELKIIEKNAEKQLSEEKLKIISPKPALLEEEIKLLEKENAIKKDQLNFYKKNREDKIASYKKDELDKNEQSLSFKRRLLTLRTLEKKYSETELVLKNSELAQYVAELNYEKSKIAAAYRDKTEPVPENKDKQGFIDKYVKRKDPDDRYGYRKYEKFYIEKTSDLNKARVDFTKAEIEYFKEQKKMENTD